MPIDTIVSFVALGLGLALYLILLIRDVIRYNKIMKGYNEDNQEAVDQAD